MRKVFYVFTSCILICFFAYRWGGAKLEEARIAVMEQFYVEVSKIMFPQLYLYEISKETLVYQDVEEMILPVLSGYRRKESANAQIYEDIGQEDFYIKPVENSVENEEMSMMDVETENTIVSENSVIETIEETSRGKQIEINRIKLQDFDYLRQNFYQVDNTTTIGSDQLNVEKLLGKDMTLQAEADGPQILIYHTHSQEAYADSAQGDTSTSVVALGSYLATLLEEKYGIKVMHHIGQYDVEKRDSAYANALPDLEQILRENPSIEVVIDLHRDGVPETTHLVTEIDGKPTAQIMFFNGLSRTTKQGDLEYLKNPYIEENLAFSFQMQLAATEYYPGLARRIYLKGYRYNMHLCPKSLLIEVGAQTNTFQEAKNAIEPLAEILAITIK